MREDSKCDEYIFGGIIALIRLDCAVLAFRLIYGIVAMIMSIFASTRRTRPKIQSCGKTHSGSGPVNK